MKERVLMKKIIFALLALISLTALFGCAGKEVTVSFEENGGEAISDMQVVQETTITEPVVLRAGYTFEGWFEDLELTKPFSFNTKIVRNLTLYAKWSINTYDLTFVYGNGTDDLVITDEYSSTFTFPEDPEKTGYRFNGWFLDETGTDAFTSSRIPSEDTVVYANWIQNQYTVNFYIGSDTEPTYTEEVLYGEAVSNAPALPVVTGMNSAWSEDITNISSDLDVYVTYTKKVFDITFQDTEGTTYETLTLEYGDTVTPPTAPSKTGYDFIGYYAPSLERNIDFTNYTVSSDLVLVDNFQIKSFTVKFYGGETASLIGDVQHVDYLTSATAPTVGLDREGYTFTGWDIAFNEVTSDLEVHAVYTVNQYNAVFDANGGVYTDASSTKTVTADYNSRVLVPETPTREDYKFLGWYYDLAFENEAYFGTSGISLPADGFTVYAKWLDLSTQSYTVSGTYYFSEEGIASDQLTKTDTFTDTHSEVYTPFNNVAYHTEMTPVREIVGYEFYKYVINGEAYFDEADLILISNDVTVDVYYHKTILTLSFSETIDGITSVTDYYVYYNETLDNTPTPTGITGYDYLGYYAPSLERFIDFNNYTVTTDLALETTYKIQSFSVSFFGGENDSLLGSVQTVNYGDSATAPVSSLERTGYTFAGWDVAFDEVTSDLEVHAVYTVNQYNAVFDANGGVFTDASSIISITADYNSRVLVPEIPTRADYEFLGWYLDLNSENRIFFGSTGKTLDVGGFTVYAKWLDLSTQSYTVSGNYYFYEEGIASDALSTDNTFSLVADDPYSNTVEYNHQITPAVDFEGYEFYKYVINGQEYFDETGLVTITEDVIIHVYYRKTIVTLSVTENIEGVDVVTDYYAYYNTPLSAVPTPQPVTGYDFLGYYAPSLDRIVDLSTFTTTVDVDFMASFEIQTFNVRFFGGENDTVLGDVQVIDYGTSATAPTVGLERVGYTFTGWDQAFDTVTSDIDVHAVYTINQYDAVFNGNGGTFANESGNYVVTQAYHTSVTVPEVPVKDGFIFDGWYYDLAFENEAYFGTNGIVLPIDGFTVYAKWIELVATKYTVSGTYYYYEEGIALDERSKDGVYSLVNSETYTPFNNVLYNTEMSPVRDIEGYTFYKYVYNGVEYFDESELITVTDDATVDVYYHRVILTVTFTDRNAEGSDTTTYYVYYGQSLQNVPVPTPVSGMTVEWEQQNFDNIKNSFNVGVIQYDDSLETVIFMSNGTIIYIATNETSTADAVVMTSDSALWNISQTGYRFLGWYVAGTETLVTQADLKYNDSYFTENITTLEARWLALDDLNPATIVSITTDSTTKTITIDFEVSPTSVEGADVYPTDFVFILNGEYIQSSDVLNDSLMNYITATGDNFTLTLAVTDPYYDLFKVELMSAEDNYQTLIAGTHTLQIISIGDNQTVLSSDPSAVYQYKVESVYEGIPESSTIKDYYIIEDFGSGTLRYVFYTNLTYQFEGMSFDIESGSNHITASNNKLSTTNIPGEFRFTITDESGSRSYAGLVIKDIRQFDIGTSYQNYLKEVNATLDDDAFLAPTVDHPYYVGASNNFYLDITISDNNGVKIPLDDVLLDYEVYLNGSMTPLDETTLETYVTFDGNNLDFTSSAIGESFRIVVEPKYEATLMDMNALEYNIVVNDGYNAFTNGELKTLFKNINVNHINIHRDIEAALDSNQMYEDGSPKNFYAKPTNDYQDIGNVYYRINGSTDDDQITVDGNFMTIDASDIQYINTNLEGQGTLAYAQGFDIVNDQIGIFYYNVSPSTVETTLNNNQFVMNNLKLIGNTTTPSVNYSGTEEEIYNQERLMSQNSGGMLGVIIRNGKASLNNLVIGYTVIGVTTNAYGENDNQEALVTDLDYVSIYDSWANSIYLHGGSGVSVNNTTIGTSGGAAIHFEDTHPGDGGYDNPLLTLGNNNEINNWISGQESWFKAYAMSSVALQLKSSINNGITPLGKTVIQMQENPVSGLPTEMMNLVFLSLPVKSAVTLSNPNDSTSVISASEIDFSITDDTGTNPLNRDWNFTEQLWPVPGVGTMVDPRVQSGQYAFAVGSLSHTYSFLAMISDIKATYNAYTGGTMSDEVAGNLAMIAGFYHLTADEMINIAGYMNNEVSMQDAIKVIKGVEDINDFSQPKYIEVVSPLDVTGADGNATILIEMFNISDSN